MTEIIETIYVNPKTMSWLKDEGRDLLIALADDASEEEDGYFDVSIFLENEGVCSKNDSECDNDCPKKVVVPKDKIKYIVRWEGFEKAHRILDYLEYVCKSEGIQKILNKQVILKKGLLDMMGVKYKKKKKEETFLVANCGEEVDLKKWLDKDEIPKAKKVKSKKTKNKKNKNEDMINLFERNEK